MASLSLTLCASSREKRVLLCLGCEYFFFFKSTNARHKKKERERERGECAFRVQNFIHHAAARVVPGGREREREREREGSTRRFSSSCGSLSLSLFCSLSLFSFEFDKKIGLIFPEDEDNERQKCVALFPTTARRGVRFRRLSSRRAGRRERRVFFFFEGSVISGCDARPSCLCSSASCISSITPSRDW